MFSKKYQLQGKVWLSSGIGGWHFVNLPVAESSEISETFGDLKKGWGSIPVTVTMGKTRWKTSIFPSKKDLCYLLAIKADVRRRENITVDDTIDFEIEIDWLF